MNQGKIRKWLTCILAILMLSACGGGDGGVVVDDDGCRNPYTIPATGTAYVTQRIFLPVLTGTDATPADAVESAGPNPQMLDNVLSGFGAYLIGAPSNDNNIVIEVTGGQVGAIFLYTLNNLGVVPPGMTWRLYSNDVLGTPWQAEALTSADVSYDSGVGMFVITFPAGNLTANYLKIVIDNTAPPINFTEVAARLVILGTPETSGCAD